MINWYVSREDDLLISEIADRASKELNSDYMKTLMDITACHANGIPLRLEELFKASKYDFAHDVNGIASNINRTTGKLENFFVPRYASSQ